MLLAPSPSPTPSPTPDPHTPAAVEYLMSPTAVCIVLLLALVVDYMSIGPNSIRDRIAFLLAVSAVREGFNESPLDEWTVERLRDIIQTLLDATGGARIAGASINLLIGAMVGLLWIYVIGCMLPVKLGKRLGRFATIQFRASPLYRLNLPLWIAAILLGLMSDLPGGVVGDITRTLLDIVTALVAPLPAWLFGDA
ncbi:hypothetical protein GA0070616_4346 [Micromonospora nigra]|uniref:Uncharacterized protein n=1 Tax=Micromonospora nigra TaxID=145857 RepID=A0A1C6SQJ6_9ACTN|nr:hypothetical protein [Micromonospora nigra]SCL31864.1 hypothetical protein GA0070616_4346 [Micromonospora nigra]